MNTINRKFTIRVMILFLCLTGLSLAAYSQENKSPQRRVGEEEQIRQMRERRELELRETPEREGLRQREKEGQHQRERDDLRAREERQQDEHRKMELRQREEREQDERHEMEERMRDERHEMELREMEEREQDESRIRQMDQQRKEIRKYFGSIDSFREDDENKPRFFTQERRIEVERERDRPEALPEELANFLRREFPHAMEEWERAQRRPLPERMEVAEELREFAQNMRELREENPEVYEIEKQTNHLERQSEEMGEEIRKQRERHVNEEALGAIKKELAHTLEALFDLREQRRERELHELERETQKLRETLKARHENRSAIIERRLRDLTGVQDALDW